MELDAPEPSVEPTLETRLLAWETLSLKKVGDLRQEVLAPSLSDLYQQIDRPRANIGSGPPGRLD
jgi:hypothetical protein